MKIVVAIFGLMLLSGCAQYLTNDSERAALIRSADQKADVYLQCVQNESGELLDISQDAAFIVERAKSACASELESYRMAQSDYLETEYIMIDPALTESVAALDQRSMDSVAQMLMESSGGDAASALAATPAAGSAGTPATSGAGAASAGIAGSSTATAGNSAAAPAASVPPDFTPSFDQRVYLDCMRDQASKYVRLNESAADIAAVAANRCRTHLTGGNRAVLEEQGRMLVMGAIFDARVQATSPSSR